MKPDPALPYLTNPPPKRDRRIRPTLSDGTRMGKREMRFWQSEVQVESRRICLRPLDPLAYSMRGNARLRLGRAGAALLDFDRSIALGLESASDYFDRAGALFDLGRYEESIQAYDRAIELGFHRGLPGSGAVVFYNRGLAESRLGRKERAIADYGLALQRHSAYADALNNRGNLLVELGRYDEALVDFERGVALAPKDALMHDNRANALLRLCRSAEALTACDTALTFSPKDPIALFNKACALAQLGRFDEAVEWLERAIAVDPQNAYDAREDPDLRGITRP